MERVTSNPVFLLAAATVFIYGSARLFAPELAPAVMIGLIAVNVALAGAKGLVR
jgi:hypothetical protein